jgi:hypothetical protein
VSCTNPTVPKSSSEASSGSSSSATASTDSSATGTADVDRILLTRERRELRQRVPDGGVRRTVEDEPHRALVAVLRDEHHGSMEVRVVEDGSRDQQLPAQRLAHPTTVVDCGRRRGAPRGALLLGVLRWCYLMASAFMIAPP